MVLQRRKLKNAKLHDYFHTITNSDMAGVKSQTLLF
jgi:putative hydrolase of the HAD superfamily